MKKVLFILLLAISFIGKAQIVFEHRVDSTFYGYLFYPTKISSNETKYVFLDTVADEFSLYNLDFTPFMTNISVPHALRDSDQYGVYFYHIMYITRSLFDCDSTNIEYLFAAQNAPPHPLWVMRTDGTTLLYADSSRGPYCLGCPGGTNLLRPILVTDSGTKLVIMKDYPSNGARDILIYALCGTFTEDNYDFMGQDAVDVQIFPNPSSMQLTFQINLPDNLNKYDFIVVSDQAQEIKRMKLNNSGNQFSIDVRNYSNGTYYYSLVSDSRIVRTGKFIITK